MEESYRQIVEASSDGLWLVDAQGRTVFVNDRVAELLGRDIADLAQLRVTDVFANPWWATDAGALDVQRLYVRPDGTEIPLLVSERPLCDVEGTLTGRLHQIVDDRRRWALLAEYRRSQAQLAEAQSIARIGSWELWLRPQEVNWTAGMYDVLGVDPDAFVPGPEGFMSRVLDQDRGRAEENWVRITEDRDPEDTLDLRVRRADGEVRWVRAVGRVLEYDDSGVPARVGGTVQDIHDLKQAELTLIDAVEINTMMQVLASAANESRTMTEALRSLRDLLLTDDDWQRGVAFDVAPGDRLEYRPVGGDADVVPTDVERAVASRALRAGEPVFEEESRPDSPLLGFPVFLDGAVVAVLVITARSPFERHAMMRSLVDQVAAQLAQVAARDRAGVELAVARDEAMAASQAKSDFLAMMSHEIRTPLNGVIGLNDLLLHTDLDPRQRELAEAMQGAGRALLVLISDILDFSKIEAGRLELESVEFQPAVVVEGVRDLFAADALSRGIALEVDVSPDVPRHVEGDPSRFGQILSNLVSNAVKFTHEGCVRVGVTAETVGRAVTLRVQVVDTGVGLDDEQRGRIFQPFRQADVSTNRTFGGTGLGLAIAHRLAGALGGEIGVESVPGLGSTFWFTSTFRVSEERSRGPVERVPGPSRSGGHVLVVEDNEVNQLVAVGMLQVLGYTSEVAGDGAAAAARVAAGRFDAVLMDLQMPRLDGFGATRLIRQSEPPGVRVPIIALTASATAGEEQRCREAGMTGFLTKPVRLDALGAELTAQLTPSAPAPEAVVPEPALVVLDPSRLAELAEMGEEARPLIQRAIDNFVEGAAENLDVLRRFWRERDAAALRAASHKLKGSAANLGANRVAEVALAVEKLAEEGAVERVGDKLLELAAELDDAVAALAAYEIRCGSGPAWSPQSRTG